LSRGEGRAGWAPPQLHILQILWAAGPTTVADAHAGLPGGAALAYTTVATMLRKMDTRDVSAADLDELSPVIAARGPGCPTRPGPENGRRVCGRSAL
jgi:hypothetical protein